MNKKFGELLKKARGEMTLRDAEERIGLSYGAIWNWERGKKPSSADFVRQLADGYETPRTPLLLAAGYDPSIKDQAWDSERYGLPAPEAAPLTPDAPESDDAPDPVMEALSRIPGVSKVVKRRVRLNLGSIPAGVPAEREARFREAHEEGSEYELTVSGISMEPIFRDGDLIVVNPDMSPKSGDYVALVVNGESVLRQFVEERENGERRRIFRALNDGYEDVRTGDIIAQGVVTTIKRRAIDIAREREENAELKRRLAEVEKALKGEG